MRDIYRAIELSSNGTAVAAIVTVPQLTTEPSALITANAKPLEHSPKVWSGNNLVLFVVVTVKVSSKEIIKASIV